MDSKIKISSPKYQQIAADLAAKIVDGNYKVGDRVYARSALASQYGVSSETARRAICVLSDLGIVQATRGSGVVIRSYDNAVKFVRQHSDVQTLIDLKQEIVSSVDRQAREIEFLYTCLSKLIEKTERFRALNPLAPFQLDITKDTPYLNNTTAEVNFWQNTFATIVAIRRDDSLLLSPGPYAIFKEGDTLFFVGDESCSDSVRAFMYPKEK